MATTKKHKITGPFRKIIDYSLFKIFLNSIKMEKFLKKKLEKECEDKESLKIKEKIDFYLIEIVNQEDFEFKFKDCLKYSGLKLIPAKDSDLLFFTPSVWIIFSKILKGTRIIILKENSTIRHGLPVYLASETKMRINLKEAKITFNTMRYIGENQILKEKTPLYVLAKADKNWEKSFKAVIEQQTTKKVVKKHSDKVGNHHQVNNNKRSFGKNISSHHI